MKKKKQAVVHVYVSVCVHVSTGIWFCFTEFSLLKEKPGSDVSIVEVGFHTDLQVYLQLRQTWILMREFFSKILLVPLQHGPLRRTL